MFSIFAKPLNNKYMSDLSSYTERDAFNEALCNLVEEYLQEKDKRSTDTVIAVNSKTK